MKIDIQKHMSSIHSAWQHKSNQHIIIRSFKFKGFSDTMNFINELARISEQENHHPDVEFGYNHCHVTYTTHDQNDLTERDFNCAKQVDTLYLDNFNI